MDAIVLLIPILLADILNPVLFAFLIYAGGTSRPIANATCLLLGHTAAYFSAGVVLAVGMDAISDRLSHPKTIDFYIELLLGVVLLYVTWLNIKRHDTAKTPEDNPLLSPFKAFILGAIVNFVGIPFAIPYFAAIDIMLKFDPSAWGVVTMLASYNLGYMVVFSAVPILLFLKLKGTEKLLGAINEWLTKVTAVLMTPLLGVIALVMISDALFFIFTGDFLISY